MKLNTSLILFMFMMFNMNAQHMNITFCGGTDEVEPILDKNGKDQRHKGAIILDYIVVKKFGGSTAATLWSISKNSSDWAFDTDTFIDRCENSKDPAKCSNCGTCKPPSAKGQDFGTLDTKFEKSVRVRGKDGNLYMESVGLYNQVCYTTQNINLEDQKNRSVSIELGWTGTKEGDFSSKNVRIYYSFNDENVKRWDKIINKTSAILGTQTARLSKSTVVPNIDVDGVNDLSKIVALSINPNPVVDVAYLNFNSNQNMELKLDVLDMLGRAIISKRIQVTSGDSAQELNISDLKSGSYVLQLSNREGLSSTQKIEVQ